MDKLVVLDSEGNFRDSSHDDLKMHHPKCDECGHRKGIHGFEGNATVFCQVWNRPVAKDGYCNNHKL